VKNPLKNSRTFRTVRDVKKYVFCHSEEPKATKDLITNIQKTFSVLSNHPNAVRLLQTFSKMPLPSKVKSAQKEKPGILPANKATGGEGLT
jgi:hypothetical protein